MKKGSLEQQNECTPRITCFILLSLFLTLSRMCSCSFNFLRRCGTGCHESNPTANLRKPFVEYHCSITHFYHARFYGFGHFSQKCYPGDPVVSGLRISLQGSGRSRNSADIFH